MGDLLKSIPSSTISFLGLGIVIIGGLIFSSFAQEIGKLLFRKFITGGKEKRQEQNPHYNGIDRRLTSSNKELETAMAHLVETISRKEEILLDFVSTWKESHFELKEDVSEIKRKQDHNWRRAWEEGFPTSQQNK
jgi:hypothetical protein